MLAAYYLVATGAGPLSRNRAFVFCLKLHLPIYEI